MKDPLIDPALSAQSPEAALSHFAAIVQFSDDAIISKALDGTITSWNPAVERLLGYSAAEAIGRSIRMILPPDRVPEEDRILATLRRGERVEHFETVRVRKDGTPLAVSVTISPIRDAAGRIVGASKVMRDTTERNRVAQALRTSEARLRRLVESDILGVIVADTAGFITESNDAFLQMIRASRQELLAGKLRWDEMTPPEWREVDQRITRQLRERGAAVPVEKEYFRRDGSRVPVLVGVVAWEGRAESTNCICFVLDLSSHKHAQETVRLQSTALAAAANAIIITDRHGTICWINPAFTVLTGFSADEAVGNNPRMLKSGQHDPAFYRAFWTTVLSSETWHGEFINRRKDGSLFYNEQTVTALRSAGGDITHFVGIMQDVTARKHAEEQIREQARLLDLAQDAILVRDLEHRVQFWNKGAERLYGWTAKEILGRAVPEILYPDRSAFDAAWQIVLKKGEWSGELRQWTRGGHLVVVDSRWNLLHDEQGNPKSVLVIHTDITQRKQVEAQFLRAQRLESVGTLATGVAHDLNNVLAPILMAAQMIPSKPLDGESRKMLDTIATNAQRGAQVVKQLLTFARGVEGEKVLLQPRHVIKELVRLLGQTFPKAITLEVKTPRDLWPIHSDATQLHQVLLNLCVNARDAMPDGGTLGLSAENLHLDESFASAVPGAKPGPHVLLRVHDTGAGIPRSDLDKIFDPFFTTKQVGKGTGLGLSTVLGIVKNHGGFITVDSEAGKGSVFNVYLPASPGASVVGPALSKSPLPRGHGELILLVDDEPAVREVSGRILEKFGYTVVTASDGVEALAAFSQRAAAVQLVLTDVLMPSMDGVALTRVLRKMNPRVKVIATSGGTGGGEETGKAAEIKALGISAFLEKPYTTEKLLMVLSESLRSV